MSPQRKLTAREQFVVDQAIVALGISDLEKWRSVQPILEKAAEWWVTMQKREANKAETWHRVKELLTRIGFEEGVRWAFRTLAIIGTMLVSYLVAHHFAISTGLLGSILGSG